MEVLEIALALTLLTGGGLAAHGFLELADVDLGFRTEDTLTFWLPVGEGRLIGREQIGAFYRDLLDQVRAVSGVDAASISFGVPLSGPSRGVPFTIAGRPGTDPSATPFARFNMVSPEYHATLGIRLARGRAFTDQDRAGGEPVAIVNEAFVRTHLPDVDPMGQRIVTPPALPGGEERGEEIQWRIVGVSADVRHVGPRHDVFPGIEVPFWQSPWPQASVAVRAAGNPASVERSLATVIRSLDPDLPLGHLQTMKHAAREVMAADRFRTVLFVSFAVVALLLAAVGIYGVMSFVVAQRTREIGLRMALGATRARVLVQVLREGMSMALVGAALGSAGAHFVAKTMQKMVYGVGGLEVGVFVATVLTLLGVALAAGLVPAWRAASVDPARALRQE